MTTTTPMPPLRHMARMKAECQALSRLAQTWPGFMWSCQPRRVVFHYTATPGLLLTPRGLEMSTQWAVSLLLSPSYPLASPTAALYPSTSCNGTPYHPNVYPRPPFVFCYGHHLPVALLNELAQRFARVISLSPGQIMVDERDALNPRACDVARRLIREGAAPLRTGVPLPDWCRAIHEIHRARSR